MLTETSLCFQEVVSYLMLEPGLQPLTVYSRVLQDLFPLGIGGGLLLESQHHHSAAFGPLLRCI